MDTPPFIPRKHDKTFASPHVSSEVDSVDGTLHTPTKDNIVPFRMKTNNVEHPPPSKSRNQAELQRRRHVELVRQSRLRKKSQRTYLKQLNQSLEQELHQCLTTHHILYESLYDKSSAWDAHVQKYVDTVHEIRYLRKEQYALKDRLLSYDTIEERLELLQNDCEIPRSIESSYFNPLTLSQANDIMIDCKTQALSFFQHKEWSTIGEQTHGWAQHQRFTSDGVLQFHFSKHILSMNCEELIDATWKEHCDANVHREIYTSVQRLEVLQMINDDTRIFQRDLRESDTSPIYRTIYLLSRIRLENGYVICYRSYNPLNPIEDEEDVQWMDVFYWLMVLEPPSRHGIQPKGCDVRFGGNLLNLPSGKHAIRWKYDLAVALLRWESSVVAPVFAFQK